MKKPHVRHLVSLLLAASVALAGACDNETTTGHRVELKSRISADLDATRTVTTSTGWVITLKRAIVGTGAFHYYDGRPAFTRREDGAWRVLRTALAALSPIGTAHAHPGHYIAGSAMGEMLAPYSADLLAGPTDLPDGYGITGTIQSATFSFEPSDQGPMQGALAGNVAIAEGSATKDGKTVYFSFTAAMADVEHTAKNGEVTGCIFDASDVEAPGVVTVTVKPRVWFNFIDFSTLDPGTPEAPTVVPSDAVAHIAFALGLAQLSAYEFSFSPATN
jgi:hypothetical protein